MANSPAPLPFRRVGELQGASDVSGWLTIDREHLAGFAFSTYLTADALGRSLPPSRPPIREAGRGRPPPEPGYQEVGVAYVELEPGAQASPAELLGWARGRLANYKVPKSLVLLGELPTLPNEKIDKHRLQRLASGTPTRTCISYPVTLTQRDGSGQMRAG